MILLVSFLVKSSIYRVSVICKLDDEVVSNAHVRQLTVSFNIISLVASYLPVSFCQWNFHCRGALLVSSWNLVANCSYIKWKRFWTAGAQMKWRKKFQGFNGIRTHGLCVCAAVLYQLSYEVPHIGSRPIYWAHLSPWEESNIEWEWFWTTGIQMKMWSLQL